MRRRKDAEDTEGRIRERELENIADFIEGELKEKATCANFAQVQIEGNREVSRDTTFYNLDMIIAVGYRVNSIGQ